MSAALLGRNKEATLLRRRAVTLIEVLVALFIVGILTALLLPAVMSARESARRSQCQSHLRQLGVALSSYESSQGTFPCGAIAGTGQSLAELLLVGPDEMGIRTTGFALLLPHMGEDTLAAFYDFRRGWDRQPPQVVDQVIPILVCPSASHDNPFSQPRLDRFLELENGTTFGITDYAFCKGVFDGWCVFPRNVRRDERGMFDVSFLRGATGFAIRAAEITDGLSNTIALGEAACGPSWPVCQGPGCIQPATGCLAMNAWAVQPNFRDIALAGLALTSTFGSTIDPINKKPVTQTVVWASPGDVDDILLCRCSTDGRAEGRPTGMGQTSGFRSDHPHGALFLYADGSVHFLEASAELGVLQALSTIQGHEN